MTLTRVTDFSEGADLTQATIDCWKAKGVTRAIVQYSEKLPAYLAALAGQGLDIDVYVYVYFPLSPWGQTPLDRVKVALGMIADSGVKVGTVWVDAEDPGDATGPANWSKNMELALDCLDAIKAAGYGTGVYTSIYRFEERFGSYMGFFNAGARLWDANYLSETPNADFTLEPTVVEFRAGAYGGWAKPDISQWHNTTMFCGHSVDLNVMEAAPVPAPPPPLPDYRDLAAAMASADHFLRNGFNLSDLSQGDRDLIKQFAGLLP